MPVPRPCLVTDLVVRTPWSTRRNRFYWESTAPITGLTQLEHCCNSVLSTIGPFLAEYMTTQCAIQMVEGRWYGTGTTGFEGNSTIAPIAGTIAAVTPNSPTDASDSTLADTLPDEVCFIVQKRTGNTGRHQMGRWFFCGLSEQVQNAGQIDASILGDVRAMADSLSNSLSVTGAFVTTLHARHWNRKSNALMPITKCYALRTMGTRKDRRRPLKLERA